MVSHQVLSAKLNVHPNTAGSSPYPSLATWWSNTKRHGSNLPSKPVTYLSAQSGHQVVDHLQNVKTKAVTFTNSSQKRKSLAATAAQGGRRKQELCWALLLGSEGMSVGRQGFSLPGMPRHFQLQICLFKYLKTSYNANLLDGCLYCTMDHAHGVFRRLEMQWWFKNCTPDGEPRKTMFHPDPEAHQIQQQLHLANSCYMMVSKKK